MTKKVRTAVIVLSVLLVISVAGLTGTLIYKALHGPGVATAVVPNNLMTPEAADESGDSDSAGMQGSIIGGGASNPPAATNDESASEVQNQSGTTTAGALYLYEKNENDNTPFTVKNMFPGDSETKYFCVRVSHKGSVTVRYHADIREGYEKLAEVLKCRITLLTTGEVMYDGLMRDMPASLNHALATDTPVTNELYYEITAYLDTSVGNEYQNKELIADFRWWVEEIDNLYVPQTGDTSVAVYGVLAAASLLVLAVLLKRSRKEEADCEE